MEQVDSIYLFILQPKGLLTLLTVLLSCVVLIKCLASFWFRVIGVCEYHKVISTLKNKKGHNFKVPDPRVKGDKPLTRADIFSEISATEEQDDSGDS